MRCIISWQFRTISTIQYLSWLNLAEQYPASASTQATSHKDLGLIDVADHSPPNKLILVIILEGVKHVLLIAVFGFPIYYSKHYEQR